MRTERGAAMKRKGLLIPLVLLLAVVIGFLVYASVYYRAGGAALEALRPDGVRVEETGYGWLFDGPGEDAALVFYPGAKVEETAYAPLLRELAEGGLDVCLVKMPLRFAFFGANAADGVMARYDYGRWYIGGHSLGGAMAAYYAAGHELSGVILLAAYPTKALDEPMLLICGSEDGVVDRARVAAAGGYGSVEELEIPGGNHALFGDYGEQRGDGAASISGEEQRRETAEAILAWVEAKR